MNGLAASEKQKPKPKPVAPTVQQVEVEHQPPEMTAAELLKRLAPDPVKDTWRRRGKDKGGETPAETWARENKKVRDGQTQAAGGMKHLQWTVGLSMDAVKSMRSSYD